MTASCRSRSRARTSLFARASSHATRDIPCLCASAFHRARLSGSIRMWKSPVLRRGIVTFSISWPRRTVARQHPRPSFFERYPLRHFWRGFSRLSSTRYAPAYLSTRTARSSLRLPRLRAPARTPVRYPSHARRGRENPPSSTASSSLLCMDAAGYRCVTACLLALNPCPLYVQRGIRNPPGFISRVCARGGLGAPTAHAHIRG